MAERIDSFEQHVKAKQEQSPINKVAKFGRRLNLFTIPIGIGIGVATGGWGFFIADVASDVAYSEVQRRNSQRIEDQERGKVKLMSRKSRLALINDVKAVTQTTRPGLQKAA